LTLGRTRPLNVDVGPVITAEAREAAREPYRAHARPRPSQGHQLPLPASGAGHFRAADPHRDQCSPICQREVFGPVLHVIRYPREDLDKLIDDGQRLGLRPDLRCAHAPRRDDRAMSPAASRPATCTSTATSSAPSSACSPSAARGLSGTGPKAGGPLYVHRLLTGGPAIEVATGELAGPVGERNRYSLRPKGAILCVAADPADLSAQQELVRSTGNSVASGEAGDIAAVLFSGGEADLLHFTRRMAERLGRIVPVHVAPHSHALLFDEVSLSINTAAAGGNASLMAIG
jgi:RHH-type proline utilization regulon transcriptional repressor/proline dehydrogenase/delta 1-pyrroline-5-carboxylate dehydrogenase